MRTRRIRSSPRSTRTTATRCSRGATATRTASTCACRATRRRCSSLLFEAIFVPAELLAAVSDEACVAAMLEVETALARAQGREVAAYELPVSVEQLVADGRAA